MARVEAALEHPSADGDAVIGAVVEATSGVLGLTGACWHLTDPETGLPTSNAALGDPAGTLEWSLDYEFRRRDFNRFADLRRRRIPIAAVSLATGGSPRASPRFREMVEPMGARDELRVAFVDPFGIWAALVLFTERRMTEDDLAFATDLLTPVTRAVRASAALAARAGPAPAGDDAGPAVIVLDAADRILAADAAARRRLSVLPEFRTVALPGVVAFVSANARWSPGGRAPTARMRATDGRWLTVDGSRLDDDGTVAVVIQPASAASVLDATLRAYGLTAREREVAGLLHCGHSTKTIAAQLVISPHTVQDHIKAVHAKTGARNRAELIAFLPMTGTR